MFFYIIIFLFLFILSILDTSPRFSLKVRRNLYLFCGLFFFFLSFIRWETGTDWRSFFSYFRDNERIEDFQFYSFETFFVYVNYFVKVFSGSYTTLLFFFAIIIFPLKYVTIWKLSTFPFLSLLLYLLLYRCDIFFVRETIALAIAMYSIRFINQNKRFYFLLSILVAMQFHSSIVVFIFAYYIYHLKLTKYRVCIIVVGLIFSVTTSTVLMSFLGNNIGGVIGWKINAYIDSGSSETFGTGLSIGETIFRGTLNRAFFIIVFLYTSYKYKTNQVVVGLVKIYMANFVLFLITCPISVALSRIVNSYEQVSIILISYFLMSIGKRNRKLVVFLLGMYFFVRFYMSTLTGGYSDLFIPYKSILSI